MRDFNYDLSIPSALTATIAIAAQNPDDPESLEEVTFAAFNKGVRNRFISPEVNQVKTWSNANLTVAEKKFVKFVKLRTALDLYLSRLNRVGEGGSPADLIDEQNLDRAITYNDGQDDSKLKIRLAGEMYTDISEIPGPDLAAAKTALRYLNTARVDLENLTLGNGDRGYIGLPKISNSPDISSIIPLKFNVKLDGISGIVIGNVFKIDSSRLPELYKQNKVAFIVAGEEQEINGQDWTTTITGQATILPI